MPGPKRSAEPLRRGLGLPGIVAIRAPDGGRHPRAALPLPRAQVRLECKIAQDSLEAGAEA